MKYANTGTDTSKPEVSDISPFGLWILYRGTEYFLDHDRFPWFLNAPLRKVFAVTAEGTNHLRWPELDVDLSLDSIQSPDVYPMVYEPSPTYNKQDPVK